MGWIASGKEVDSDLAAAKQRARARGIMTDHDRVAAIDDERRRFERGREVNRRGAERGRGDCHLPLQVAAQAIPT